MKQIKDETIAEIQSLLGDAYNFIHGFTINQNEAIQNAAKSLLPPIRETIGTLEILPPAKLPDVVLPITDIDIARYKNWGYAEATYYSLTGNNVVITSQQGYEDVLQQINKEQYLNESI